MSTASMEMDCAYEAAAVVSASDLSALLTSGSNCLGKDGEKLCSLDDAAKLDLETNLPEESARSADHFNKLKSDFINSETKQRWLSALVKREDAEDGLLHQLSGAISQDAEARLKLHHQTMQAMEEKHAQANKALQEIQAHTKGLAAQIKGDIQKLLHGKPQVTHITERRLEPRSDL
jgi:hypothetical protein